MALVSMKPKPPLSLGTAKASHFIMRYFFLLPTPSQKNFPLKRVNLFAFGDFLHRANKNPFVHQNAG